MFKYLTENHEDLVAVKFTGKSDRGDYEALVPELEEKIRRYGKINLYWEMEDFGGWDLESLWKDLKFDLKHINDFKKVALVGDEKWEAWLATFIKPFTPATVKFFPTGKRDQALAWVREAS